MRSPTVSAFKEYACQGETYSQKEKKDVFMFSYLQNLKGVVSLCASDKVFWTEDLIEETVQWLQDSYTTLTLYIKSQMNDPQSKTQFR